MKKAAWIRFTFFSALGLFIAFGISSGYLYRKNKVYQVENRRLIILNDSILSENIELKNALQKNNAAAEINAKPVPFKGGKNK